MTTPSDPPLIRVAEAPPGRFHQGEQLMRSALEQLPRGRAQAIALTKLDEVRLWFDEAMRGK